MTFQEDLLAKGYFPENLPPSFSSARLAEFFKASSSSGYLSDANTSCRYAIYNASKRGMTRRIFSIMHPTTAYDLTKFIDMNWKDIREFLARSEFSQSIPENNPKDDRAVTITSHSDLEAIRLSRLSHYRFIAKTDISRFYHSIYTHSIPWAFHGKDAAKKDKQVSSSIIIFNKLDQIVRSGQDGQSIGIPVGPDTSRIIAEIICVAIDLRFKQVCKLNDITIIRHVDDVWIGASSLEDVEEALGRYREAIREFELDINETKTAIYTQDFAFSDVWPLEIESRLRLAFDDEHGRRPELIRSALEHAFSFAEKHKDDAVLKYVLKRLDRSENYLDNWKAIEPFLKRASVHFGHTIDYVSRIVIWRYLISEDLDEEGWRDILLTILNNHGRLGNDSEVCWALYCCVKLGLSVPQPVANRIINNCGALSTLSILNCVEYGLVPSDIFSDVRDRLSYETARGQYWPLFLEWVSRDWPGGGQLKGQNDLVDEMSSKEVTIFDGENLPKVFEDAGKGDLSKVRQAIEQRSGYDEIGGDEEEPAF